MPIPKLDEEAIRKIQALWAEGKTAMQISEITGHNVATIKKYGEQPISTPTEQQPSVPVMQQPEQPPVPVQPTQPKRVTLQPVYEPPKPSTIMPSHPTTSEPDEWLRTFLEKYSLNQQFTQLMAERVKLVGELPTSSQLANDIQLRNSGVKNKYDAMAIAEFYEYEVRHYLEERRKQDEMFGTPYQGIPVKEQGRRLGGGGIQVDSFTRDQRGYNQPMKDPYSQAYDGRQDTFYPQPAAGGYSQDRFARLEDSLRQRDEADRRRLEQELAEMKMQIAQGGQQSPEMQEVRMELQQLREERRKKVEDELTALKMAQGSGLREQDVLRIFESREKKLTAEDVTRLIDQRVSGQQGKTEIDVKMEELKYNRETQKDEISEKAKDRETWTQGFETIAKTAGDVVLAFQNKATGQQGTMQGTRGEQVMEANCPTCGTKITAPVSAKVIQCPGCGGKLEVEFQGEGLSQPVIPTTPPVEERPIPPQVSYTVEQPPIEPPETTPVLPPTKPPETTHVPPTEEKYEANCPYCNSPMFIPRGVSKVECPTCGKPLEVSQPQEQPDTETPRETTAEPPSKPLIEPPKELVEPVKEPPIPSPPMPTDPISKPIESSLSEPKKEIPDWREQLKKEPRPIPKPPQELEPEEPKEVQQESVEPETKPLHQVAETPLTKEQEERRKENQVRAEEELKRFKPNGFEPFEKKEIKKSIEDAREGRVTPSEDIKKIAKNLAIGEGVKKLEEEIRTEGGIKPFTKDGYTLFKIIRQSGKPWYFFGRQSEKGEPLSEVPEGWEVGKNKRSGLPYLKRVTDAKS